MPLTKKQIANRKKWVEALRSGKFKQGKRHLNANNKFCCQGVACELFKDEVGGKWSKIDPYMAYLYREGEKTKTFNTTDENGWDHSDEGVWPDEVAELLGIHPNDAEQLVAMNDGASAFWAEDSSSGLYTFTESAKFEEIADVIEFMTLAGL